MSLEQAITDHASALRELAAAIRATIGGAAPIIVADGGVAVSAAPATMESKPEPKEEAQAPSAARAAINQAMDAAKAAAAAGAPEATYEQVKAKVLALSKEKGRDTTVTLLQRHGASKAPDLKPEQYADFIKDASAVLAGEYDPETSAA